MVSQIFLILLPHPCSNFISQQAGPLTFLSRNCSLSRFSKIGWVDIDIVIVAELVKIVPQIVIIVVQDKVMDSSKSRRYLSLDCHIILSGLIENLPSLFQDSKYALNHISSLRMS